MEAPGWRRPGWWVGAGQESTNPEKGEAHGTWKFGPHSSTPSRDQRALSSHCSFGVLDEVVPFTLLSQVFYLCPIPSVPKTRPGLDGGRFVPEGKQVGLPCPPDSHAEKTAPFLLPTLPPRKPRPSPTSDTECEPSRAPTAPGMWDQLGNKAGMSRVINTPSPGLGSPVCP